MQRILPTMILGALMTHPAAPEAQPGASGTPVLVELFTSEGCSSCPPADRILESLDHSQPVPGAQIIVLSEHVDYWDEGGWKDPFSSPEFTRRQQNYVRQFRLSSAYTPQMVIDGEVEFVGSGEGQARSAIAKAARRPKAQLDLGLVDMGPARMTVRAGVDRAPAGATLFVALAQNLAESQVAGGENAKRNLRHVAVVRGLVAAGSVKAGESLSKEVNLDTPRDAGKSGFRVVAFLQERSSGRILGVTRLDASAAR